MEWSSDTVDNEHLGRRSSKCEFVSPDALGSERRSSGCAVAKRLTLAAVFQVAVFTRSRGSLASRPLKARETMRTKAAAALTASWATAGEVTDRREAGLRRRRPAPAPPTPTEEPRAPPNATFSLLLCVLAAAVLADVTLLPSPSRSAAELQTRWRATLCQRRGASLFPESLRSFITGLTDYR